MATPPVDKHVPSPGDPDRKRILNVLAQRRYRQRRREKMRALEAQAKQNTTHNASRDSASFSPEQSTSSSSLHSTDRSRSHSDTSDGVVTIDGAFLGEETLPPTSRYNNDIIESFIPIPEDGWTDAATFSLDDPSNALGFPGLTNSDLETLNDDPFTSTFLFPLGADHNVEVPLLAALNAGFKLACMLGCHDKLWDPFASRTLTSDSLPIFASLPASMQPTQAQQTIPHHPVLDMLPWPEVRTKIICCFSLPEFMRPPVARGEMPQVTLIQHIDDESEPVRIVGNEADDKGWEIGQTFYQNWWWAFDRATVEHTNRLRAERGAPKLRLLPAPEAEQF